MRKASYLCGAYAQGRMSSGKPQKLIFLGIIVFLTFLVLDLQAISVGDDLGYMFSDKALHAADGKKVETIEDITNTQITHYFTCNGRFLVHYIVQILVALVPSWAVSCMNALMFTLLWLLCCLMAYGKQIVTFTQGISVLVLLWIGLPVPGVTMLSLDAFAVNYLWVSVIVIFFTIHWLRMLRSDAMLLKGIKPNARIFMELLVFIGAVITGSLQESFSVPMIGSMIICAVIYHKTMRRESEIMLTGFILGTLALLLSPGNWGRTDAGGGMTADAIMYRFGAMLTELLGTGVPLLAVMLVVAFIVGSRRGENLILKDNTDTYIYITILVGLLLDGITFTGVRQLFFPALLSVVQICRVGSRVLAGDTLARRDILEGVLVCGVVVFCGAYLIRYETKVRMNSVEVSVKSGAPLIEIDCSGALYNYHEVFRTFFGRYDDDPFEGKYLQLVFDRYTKQGLTRSLRGESSDLTIVPCSLEKLYQAADESVWHQNVVKPGKIDNRYGAFVVKKDEWKPSLNRAQGGRAQFERVGRGDSVYYIVPLVSGEEMYKMKRSEQK